MGVDVDDEEDDEEANNSPDTSSIFDTSANDASWATAATDAASTDLPPLQASVPLLPPPPPPQQQSRRSLTREQAREKAEILRLRLGLASYKLRTGQTSVPLDDLQLKPLPPRVRVHGPERAPAEARTTDEEEEEQQQQQQTKDEQEDVAGKEGSQGDGDEDMDAAADAPSLPRISPSKAMATPRRTQLLALEDEDAERRLTSSALRGGAANGLLSLAMSASKQV
jgi:hypothetical protein